MAQAYPSHKIEQNDISKIHLVFEIYNSSVCIYSALNMEVCNPFLILS